MRSRRRSTGRILTIAVFAAVVTTSVVGELMAQAHATLRDLLTAARHGDVSAVKAALAAGADVNGGDPTYGQTALMRAAMFGQAETTAALLAAGARSDVTAVDRRTALHWAAVAGSAEVGRLLAKAGAPVNAVAVDESPLGFAVDAGSLATVTALVEAGATPESMRQSVADHVNMVLGNRWQDDRLEIARVLIRSRKGLSRPDTQGRPLAIVVAEWAHQTGAAAMARELRAAGVPLDGKDAEGRTALEVVRRKLTTERNPDYRAAVQATLDGFEGRAR